MRESAGERLMASSLNHSLSYLVSYKHDIEIKRGPDFWIETMQSRSWPPDQILFHWLLSETY